MVPPDTAEIFMISKNKPTDRRERTLPASNFIAAPPTCHHHPPSVLVRAGSEKSLRTSREWGTSKTSSTLKDRLSIRALEYYLICGKQASRQGRARRQQMKGDPGDSEGLAASCRSTCGSDQQHRALQPLWGPSKPAQLCNKNTHMSSCSRKDKLMKERRQESAGRHPSGPRGPAPHGSKGGAFRRARRRPGGAHGIRVCLFTLL